MKLINGKEIANIIKEEIREKVNNLRSNGIVPTLAIVQVGDNPASNIYINNKIKLCKDLNCNVKLLKFSDEITEAQLIEEIRKLNKDNEINGILVQLPLNKNINEETILEEIEPIKDVDCFTLRNVGKLWTAKKHEVIVGRSNIVGKPLAGLFLLENATVTICHSHTKNLQNICSKADILVAAIGKPKFFTKEFVKEGADIIDVGINRLEDRKICGDVDFEDVKDKVNHITPVPGGVGPMTVMMVLQNLINLVLKQKGLK